MTTTIEWCARPETLPEVLNLVGGCSPAGGPGCTNCWSARPAATRLKHHPLYEGLTKWVDGKPRWTGEIRLDESKLEQPLHWRKPRTVFVNSTSDLYHPGVPFEFIESVWLQMLFCKRHTFLVLTKRPERIFDFLDWYANRHCIDPGDLDLPYLNVWLGVSVENADYLWRIEKLMEMPAAVRFVSLEPLLSSVNLHMHCDPCGGTGIGPGGFDCPICGGEGFYDRPDWVCVGGESGPGARYCDPDWIRDIIAQCKAAGVPVFVKALGTDWARKQSYLHYRGRKYNYKGADMEEWPAGLRVREFPE